MGKRTPIGSMVHNDHTISMPHWEATLPGACFPIVPMSRGEPPHCLHKQKLAILYFKKFDPNFDSKFGFKSIKVV